MLYKKFAHHTKPIIRKEERKQKEEEGGMISHTALCAWVQSLSDRLSIMSLAPSMKAYSKIAASPRLIYSLQPSSTVA